MPLLFSFVTLFNLSFVTKKKKTLIPCGTRLCALVLHLHLRLALLRSFCFLAELGEGFVYVTRDISEEPELSRIDLVKEGRLVPFWFFVWQMSSLFED